MKYSLIIFNLGFLGLYIYRISAIKKQLGNLILSIAPADKKYKWLYLAVILVAVIFFVYGFGRYFYFTDTLEGLINNVLKSTMFLFIAMLIRQLGPLLVGDNGLFGGSWHVIKWDTITNYKVVEESDNEFKFTLSVTDESEPIAYRVDKANTDKLLDIFSQKIEVTEDVPANNKDKEEDKEQ